MFLVHDTLGLQGVALDYALASALDWTEPFYNVGKIRYDKEDGYFMMDEPDPDEAGETTKPEHFQFYTQWKPQRNKALITLLIVKYQLAITWHQGLATVSKGELSHTDENLGTAAARIVVTYKLGSHVTLPDYINNQGG